jgi:leucyl/phenylalanyl-tRNA--protein transferase
MPVRRFPDPRTAAIDGIVAIGGDLHPETLLLAYRQGIFPWPMQGLPLTWMCPEERAVLEFDALHIPRSLAQTRRKSPFRFTIDKAFPEVIAACARAKRPDQPGTWITGPMMRAYVRFHELGHAHSVEAWEGDELVGGLYGVDVDGLFAGESMFRLRPNASKLALLHLIDHLRERGAEWIDIQIMTPHFELLGARNIPRDQFLVRLAEARERGIKLFEDNATL